MEKRNVSLNNMQKTKTLTVGHKSEAKLTVVESDAASALFSTEVNTFPSVLATSRLIALMELAAARLLQPLLELGQLSVGVQVEVTHSAPTPVGADVRAVATYLGKEGKLYLFTVEAYDAGGQVGHGQHARAIVDTDRLLSVAVNRVSDADLLSA